MRNNAIGRSGGFPWAQALPNATGLDFRIDGRVLAHFHFGKSYSKPFIFPILGPSGADLTRFGHPAPQALCDHERSVWFGHPSVRLIDRNSPESIFQTTRWNFRDEPTASSDVKIRHTEVRALHDGDDFADAVVDALWWAGGQALLHQRIVLAIVPMPNDAHALDVRLDLSSVKGRVVEFGRSESGLMSIRLAKSMTERFGGGRLCNSEGSVGAQAVQGQPARWVDHSGPTSASRIEGLCFMDHPANPRHPISWNAHADGLTEAAFTKNSAWTISTGNPLSLKYRLYAHSGYAESAEIENVWADFAQRGADRLDPAAIQPIDGLGNRA